MLIASGDTAGKIIIWELSTNNEIATLQDHAYDINYLTYLKEPDKNNFITDLIVSGSVDSTIKIWDVMLNTCIYTFVGYNCVPTCIVTFKRQVNNLIVNATSDGDIKIWNVNNGTCATTLKGDYQPVFHISYFLDKGKDFIISLCYNDDKLKIWEIKTGKFIHIIVKNMGSIDYLMYFKDPGSGNHLIITINNEKKIKIWNFKYGKCIHSLKGHKELINCIILFKDSNNQFFIASGSKDYKIKLWEIKTGNLVSTLEGHTDEINCLIHFENINGSDVIASGSNDRCIKIWKLSNQKCIYSININNRSIRHLIHVKDFHDKDVLIVSFYDEKIIKIIDINGEKCLYSLQGSTESVQCLASYKDCNNNSNMIISGGDEVIRVWNNKTGKMEYKLDSENNDSNVSAVFYNEKPYGNSLIKNKNEDGEFRIWDYNTESCIATENIGRNNDLYYFQDETGKDMIAVSDSFNVKVMENTECLSLIEHRHILPIRCLVHFRNSEDVICIASASEDKTIKISEFNNNKSIYTLKGHSGVVTCLIYFIYNGVYIIASGSQDKTIKIWNLISFKCTMTLEGHTEAVTCFVYLNGINKRGLIASGSEDRTVKIWNINSCECISTLEGHYDTINCIAFFEDRQKGIIIISGSADKTISYWETESNKSLFKSEIGNLCTILYFKDTLKQDRIIIVNSERLIRFFLKDLIFIKFGQTNTASQYNCALHYQNSQGRDILVTGSTDNVLRVWEVDTGKLIQTFDNCSDNISCIDHFKNDDRDFIIIGYKNGTIDIEEINLSIMKGINKDTQCISYLGDSKIITTRNLEKDIIFMNIMSSSITNTFHGKVHSFKKMAYFQYLNKKDFLATTDQRNAIMIWEIKSNICLSKLEGHSSDITSLIYYKDSNGTDLIISGSKDKTIKIWEINGECINTIQLENEYTSKIVCFNNSEGIDLIIALLYAQGIEKNSTINIWELKTCVLRNSIKLKNFVSCITCFKNTEGFDIILTANNYEKENIPSPNRRRFGKPENFNQRSTNFSINENSINSEKDITVAGLVQFNDNTIVLNGNELRDSSPYEHQDENYTERDNNPFADYVNDDIPIAYTTDSYLNNIKNRSASEHADPIPSNYINNEKEDDNKNIKKTLTSVLQTRRIGIFNDKNKNNSLDDNTNSITKTNISRVYNFDNTDNNDSKNIAEDNNDKDYDNNSIIENNVANIYEEDGVDELNKNINIFDCVFSTPREDKRNPHNDIKSKGTTEKMVVPVSFGIDSPTLFTGVVCSSEETFAAFDVQETEPLSINSYSSINIMDIEGKLISTINDNSKKINTIFYFKDLLANDIVASCSEQIMICVIKTGLVQCILFGHTDDITCIDYFKTKTGKEYLISGSMDKTIKLWKIQTGECLSTIAQNERVRDIFFYHDVEEGDLLLIENENNSIRSWKLSGNCLSVIGENHMNKITHLHYFNSINGFPLIATASTDNLIKIWNVNNGTCQNSLVGHTDNIIVMINFQDSNGRDIIVSGSIDKTIKLWEVNSGTCLTTLKGHKEAINCIINYKDSKGNDIIVSGGGKFNSFDDEFLQKERRRGNHNPKKQIIIWNLSDKKNKIFFEGHTDSVVCLVYIKYYKENYIASAGFDRTIQIWKASTGSLRNVLVGHIDAVVCIVYLQSLEFIISGSLDKTIKVWSFPFSYRNCIYTFENNQNIRFIYSLQDQEDKTFLVVSQSSYDTYFSKWTIPERLFTNKNGFKHLIHFQDRNKSDFIVSVTFSNKIKIWDFNSSKCLLTLKGENLIYYENSDGEDYLVVHYQNLIKVYDKNLGNECRATLEGHSENILQISYIKDKKRRNIIASASFDKTIRIWNLDTNKCLSIFYLNVYVSCLVIFKDDEKNDFIISNDGKLIKLWDLNSEKYICLLEGHNDYVTSLLQFKDNNSKNILVSSSDDKTIKIWDLDSKNCISTIENMNSNSTIDYFNDSQGRHLIISCCVGLEDRKDIKIWDIYSRECILSQSNEYFILFQDSNGREIFASGDSKVITLNEFNTSKCLLTLEDKISNLNNIFHFKEKNGRDIIVAGDRNYKIKIWALPRTIAQINSNNPISKISIFKNCKGQVQIATSEESNKVKIWDLLTGMCVSAIEELDFVYTMHYMNVDNRDLIVNGSINKIVKIWNIESKECLATFQESKGFAECFVNGKDKFNRNLLVCGNRNGGIIVWNIDTFKYLFTLTHNNNCIKFVHYIKNCYKEDFLVSGGNGQIKIWDLEKGFCLFTLGKNRDYLNCMLVYQDDKDRQYIVSGDIKKNVKIWNALLPTVNNYIYSISSMTHDSLLTLNRFGSIQLWKLVKDSIELKVNFKDKIMSISCCICFENSKMITLIVIGCENKIKIYDQNSGLLFSTLDGHTNKVIIINHFKPNDKNDLIISASWDTSIKIWDIYQTQSLMTLNGHTSYICCMTLLMDEDNKSFIISGGGDSTIKFWEITTGKCISTLNEHISDVNTIILVKNESLNSVLVSGSNDKTIKLWGTKNRKCERNLLGHDGQISCLTYVRDLYRRDLIISGSGDNSVRIWNMMTGSCLFILSGHKSIITECIHFFDTEGNYLIATVSRDKTAKIWDLNSGKLKLVLSKVNNFTLLRNEQNILIATSYKNYLKIISLEYTQVNEDENIKYFSQISL